MSWNDVQLSDFALLGTVMSSRSCWSILILLNALSGSSFRMFAVGAIIGGLVICGGGMMSSVFRLFLFHVHLALVCWLSLSFCLSLCLSPFLSPRIFSF